MLVAGASDFAKSFGVTSGVRNRDLWEMNSRSFEGWTLRR